MKIGIMGGTFDPIHYGHRQIIEKAQEQLSLDKVIIVPTSKPPHKSLASIEASAEDRFKMTQLAVEDLSYVCVSDFEMTQTGVTYTIDTLRHFIKRQKAQYYLIIGGDSWTEFDSWKDADEIKKISTIVVALRNSSDTELQSERDWIKLKMKKCEVSSSQIRKNLGRGKSVEGQVAEKVMKFIQQKSLYGWGISCQ